MSFDAATFELWVPLAHGARVCVFPGGPLDLEALGSFISDHRVRTCFLTTGLFNHLVDDDPGRLKGLRQVVTGGEAISRDHANRFVEALPHCRLINGYGPTENTTFSTSQLLTKGWIMDLAPIGAAIGHTTVFVLDPYLAPVPHGVPGELLTGGAGLARGYLGQPALTAERFIPNPYARQPGERLYRTGDLVIRHADGMLLFHGRRDGQVKIRGFRIEVDEIEAALLGHPTVANAAVLARDDFPGGKGLAAYLQAAAEAHLDTAVLQAFLRERLPSYMVPTAFIPVDHLPLNQSNKVDRKALAVRPLPAEARLGSEHGYVAPRNELEEKLAEIWADVLRLERVGIHDNFFDIGGHSLLATQILSRMREAFPEQLSLQYLFREPTIAAIAQGIADIRKSTDTRTPLDTDEDRRDFEF